MGEDNHKVLTPKQAKRVVRSLAYRRRLKPGIPKLESRLKTYLGKYTVTNENGTTALLGGFLVKLVDGEIKLEKVDPVELDQLRFEFLPPGEKGLTGDFSHSK